MPQLKEINNYTETALWGHLKEANSSDLNHLKDSVDQVAKHAKEVLKQVPRNMPDYTLHDERHMLNVLAIMDALIPEETLDLMTPLECALCIMTAYTHDLAMVLTWDQQEAIFQSKDENPEKAAYQRHRDGFSDELRLIEHLRTEKTDMADEKVRQIEGHILSDFLRSSHTYENRIKAWLDKIQEAANNASLFEYHGVNYKHELALLGASHGYDADWLRKQLCYHRDKDSFSRLFNHDQVNMAFPGLLLRLADIMDFDASRTPTILFKHLGLEGEASLPSWRKYSLREWRKHLAIKGWRLTTRQRNSILRYEAACEHPVIHKTILEFIRWIDHELNVVPHELSAQQGYLSDSDERPFNLYLPRQVTQRVFPKLDGDKAVYIYQDIAFHLDQAEIMQLLMGENLYGDPSLCLRELLQNALDALHMRELRLRLKHNGETPFEAVDDLKPDETLQLTVNWGKDEASGQDYLLVRDNGIGMTEQVIKDYFTNIGKSYYRSPSFNGEKAAFNRHDWNVTPISQFGIGILSCFMIADRIEVRTRPGGANGTDRRAYNVTISGPGSLFWLKEGDLATQGTEVKLLLKPSFQLDHHSNWQDYLVKRFGIRQVEVLEEPAENGIDPAFVVGSCVLNPLFPIVLMTDDAEVATIDQRFHMDMLDPIDTKKVTANVAKWECLAESISEPTWGFWEWTDQVTGSRVTLWYPTTSPDRIASQLPTDPASAELCRQDELAKFVETTLSSSSRSVVSVNGMLVDDLDVVTPHLRLIAGIGSKLWIDLRGAAAPRLTANRKQALEPDYPDEWQQALKQVFQRCEDALQTEMAKLSTAKNVRLALTGSRVKKIKKQENKVQVLGLYQASWEMNSKLTDIWPKMQLLQELSRLHPFEVAGARFLDLDRDLDLDRARDFALAFALDRDFALNLNLDLDFALNLARARARDLALDRDRDLALALELARDRDLALNLALDLDLDRGFERGYFRAMKASLPFHHCLSAHFLQQGLWPRLEQSYPGLQLFHLKGYLGQTCLESPMSFSLTLDDHQAIVPSVTEPYILNDLGYDFCLPLSSIPLGRLKRNCAAWQTDRSYHVTASLFLWYPSLVSNKSYTDWAERLNVNRLHVLLSHPDLWDKPFDNWDDDDLQNAGLTAQWDIKEQVIYWAEGAHPGDNMPRIGMETEAFVDFVKKKYG